MEIKFRNIVKSIVKSLYQIILRKTMRLYYCHGSEKRLHLGKHVSTMNTLFNVASGDIYIGDHTIFGHNCMVITGRHEFINGKRKYLTDKTPDAPRNGYDINIGKGCWIASGAVITGGVVIGDNTIVGANAVVTRDIPSGVFAGGIPAEVIKVL
jgi:acetyltransferase-like isoleucine patch superfamily enzyme